MPTLFNVTQVLSIVATFVCLSVWQAPKAHMVPARLSVTKENAARMLEGWHTLGT